MLSRFLKPKNPRIDPDRFRLALDRAEFLTLHYICVMAMLGGLNWALRSFGDWRALAVTVLLCLVLLPALSFVMTLWGLIGEAHLKGRPILRPKPDASAEDPSA